MADAAPGDDGRVATSGSRQVLAYGMLGLPLAFAALPIYVFVPKLYSETLGLSLTLVGAVLLISRILDAITDPLIGVLSDRFAARRVWVAGSLPLLALGMPALLAPPDGAGGLWLAAALFVVTLGYSLATINYNAWGAEVAGDTQLRTRLVAAREGFALLGVICAAVLPGALASGFGDGLARLGWLFLPLLVFGTVITFGFGARPAPVSAAKAAPWSWRALGEAFSDRPFRRLVMVFACNGIAAALPSATVLFFIADVLKLETWSGGFLALYFIAAALGVPMWTGLAARLGKRHAWLLSMILSVAVFAWAYRLGAGDGLAFAAICLFSGVALGADLVLPAAMLADRIAARREASGSGAASVGGAAFGWWNFVVKSNLALAAGLALPVLGLFGYAPGSGEAAALASLSVVYALVPVALKLLAAVLLLCLIERDVSPGRVSWAS